MLIEPKAGVEGVLVAQGGLTDNATNGAILAKGGTTKFPGCALLAELAVQAEERQVHVSVDWVPRELNSEADALTNGRTQGFDPRLRREVDLKSLEWKVLPQLLAAGQELLDMRAAARSTRRAGRRRRRSDRLRAQDPW